MGRFLAFGEIMLRLSPPGRELILQTPRFDVWVAGAEANVATALARLGHDVGFASAVPANDDAARAIRLYCEAIAIAATRGNQEQQSRRGVDIGAQVEAPVREPP